MSVAEGQGAPADHHHGSPGAPGAGRPFAPLWLLSATAGRRGDLLAFFAGAPLPLSFAPFGWYLLAPAMLALLYACWLGAGPARAALRGMLFGAAGFLTGTYWLYISLHEFGEAPLFIAVPLMLGLVAVMACYFALAGALVAGLLQWLTRATAPPASRRWALLAAMPSLLVLTEWLRSWLATGFPWFSWGYSQTDSFLAGWAPVFGVFGVSLAVAMSGGAVLLLAVARGMLDRAAALAVFAILWAGGADLADVPWTRTAGEPLDAALVQGGISQDLKWQEDQLPKTKALYRGLTDGHWDADLVVWPEAAIPNLVNLERPYFDALFEEARSRGTGLLVGAIQAKGRRGDRRFYNSVFGVNEIGFMEYHKRHLVPFGEYYPVPGFVRRWMADLNLPYTDFTPGPADQVPLRVAGEAIGVSICYEDVFGSELRRMLPEATVLVNVSNDAWFGGSVAPHQHLQIARMRALEAARPMIRATNSGISAFIEHDGAVLATAGLFEAMVLRQSVQPRTGATPFARFGDLPVLGLLATYLAATLVDDWRRRRGQSAQGAVA